MTQARAKRQRIGLSGSLKQILKVQKIRYKDLAELMSVPIISKASGFGSDVLP